MVMGCMGWNGVGILAGVEEWMDAEQYVSILEDNLLSSIENSKISKQSIVFQQDNNPENSSKKAQNWFKTQGIRPLGWQAQLLDLSSIEHLWQHFKKDSTAIKKLAKGVWKL